jgi:hypothetical protein
MKRFKPDYSKYQAGRPGLLRRFWSSVSDFVSRAGRGGKVRPPVAVVSRRDKQISGSWYKTTMLFLLLSLVIGTGGWYCVQFLERSDIFRLTMVSVQGTRMTQKQQILKLGAIEQGINLLSFDIDLAEKRINSHPWIDSVKIKRTWPSTLEVLVREYRPLAMVNIDNEKGGVLYYIDHRGKIFSRVNTSQDLDFPVITGIETTGMPEGSVIPDKGPAAEAFRFLRLAARGNPIVPLQTISEVHISPEKGLVVYLVDNPFPIYMGYDKINTRYYQLVKLLERLYRKKKVEEIKEIRMDYFEDRILVAKVEPYK